MLAVHLAYCSLLVWLPVSINEGYLVMDNVQMSPVLCAEFECFPYQYHDQ